MVLVMLASLLSLVAGATPHGFTPVGLMFGLFTFGAIIKFGHLISDARGKLNGTVFSRNTYGAYMRAKVTPVNPQTSFQAAVRNRLSDASQAWRGITEDERTGWNAIAVQFTRSNIFGDNVPLTGFNLFVRLNRNLLEIGLPLITQAPKPTTVEGVTSLAITPNATAGTFGVAYAPTPTPANHYMIVRATPGFGAGRSFFGGQFRVIGVLPPASASPLAAIADYVDRFGPLAVGQKYAVRVNFVHGLSGIDSTPLEARAIAV